MKSRAKTKDTIEIKKIAVDVTTLTRYSHKIDTGLIRFDVAAERLNLNENV